MNFSRNNPSPRYLELLSLYSEMHRAGERQRGLSPEETFPGVSLRPQAVRIKNLVQRTQAETILDYGSGKGILYNLPSFKIDGLGEWPSLIDYWEVDEVDCYDPCYPPYTKLPTGKFDGVICVDVMEHCSEEDIPWIVDEIFSFASRFVYANVACYPALAILPNGENCHVTTYPVDWWRRIFLDASRKCPGVVLEVWVQDIVQTPQGKQLVEERIGN